MTENLFKVVNVSSESALILGLILILQSDGCDQILLLALLYIML